MNDPQYASKDGSAIRIWTDTAKNNFISEQQGRPVFDEVIFVEVISPGSRGSQPVFEVERTYSKEGAEHYGKVSHQTAKYAEYAELIAKYKSNDTSAGAMSGTPLSEWPEITRSMAASLRAAEIHTVDALANIPDTSLKLVGPDGRTWREKAKAFLEAAASGAGATAQAAENARLREELEASREAQKALSDRLSAIEAASATGKPAKPAATPKAEAAPGDTLVPAVAKLDAII